MKKALDEHRSGAFRHERQHLTSTPPSSTPPGSRRACRSVPERQIDDAPLTPISHTALASPSAPLPIGHVRQSFSSVPPRAGRGLRNARYPPLCAARTRRRGAQYRCSSECDGRCCHRGREDKRQRSGPAAVHPQRPPEACRQAACRGKACFGGSPRFRVGSWVGGSSRVCRRRAGSGRGGVGSSSVRRRPA